VVLLDEHPFDEAGVLDRKELKHEPSAVHRP
jgi:hypothetical protein